jgi:hypothetical protein
VIDLQQVRLDKELVVNLSAQSSIYAGWTSSQVALNPGKHVFFIVAYPYATSTAAEALTKGGYGFLLRVNPKGQIQFSSPGQGVGNAEFTFSLHLVPGTIHKVELNILRKCFVDFTVTAMLAGEHVNERLIQSAFVYYHEEGGQHELKR